METILLIIAFILIAITSFLLGIYFSISYFKNLNYSQNRKINPIVRDIYLLFISEDISKQFIEKEYTIYIPKLGIEIWSKNSLDTRTIYAVDNPKKFYETYRMTIDEAKDSLNIYDRMILDKICKVVIKENREFIKRIFL